MKYFSIKQTRIFYSFPMPKEEIKLLNNFLEVLDDSGVSEIIKKNIVDYPQKPGKKPYDPYQMFAFIMLANAFGKSTLREIEYFGKYDLHALYILNEGCPSYKTIGEYINKVILPDIESIFCCLTLAIVNKCGIKDIHSSLFIDGTKLEADANKYKFVWKPRRRMERLKLTVSGLLSQLTIMPEKKEITAASIIEILADYMNFHNFKSMPVSGKGKKLSKEEKILIGLQKCSMKLLEYEEQTAICGPDRNSYFKTDIDATAMSLKTDYYSGHGSNFHAAYNVQFGENNGIIMTFGCYQNRADYHTFIPLIERYERLYGKYPKNVIADSGYGIEKNYRFMKEHDINAFVKFQNWQGEASGKRPKLFSINDENPDLHMGAKNE